VDVDGAVWVGGVEGLSRGAGLGVRAFVGLAPIDLPRISCGGFLEYGSSGNPSLATSSVVNVSGGEEVSVKVAPLNS
jgi:hypothetical protein